MEFVELKGLKPIQAQGLLARAALSMINDLNPAIEPVLDHELELRDMIIKRLRGEAIAELGEASPDIVDGLVTDWIEEALDASSSPETFDQAFQRLSERGDLPADAFNLEFTPAYLDLAKKAVDDRGLVAAAVKQPEREWHWQKEGFQNQVTFVGKWFDIDTRDPFFLIAMGRREGRALQIDFSFRLYPSDVTFLDTTNLQAALERFALSFPSDFRLVGQKGPIINGLRAKGQLHEMIAGSDSGTVVSISSFSEEGGMVIHWGFTFDQDKYRRSVLRHLHRKALSDERH